MILTKLNNILNTTDLNDIRHVISVYFKKNINRVGYLSIGEVAHECHVSKSMITKFSKELGYERYIDLKEACRDLKFPDYNTLNSLTSIENNYQDYLNQFADYIQNIDNIDLISLNEFAHRVVNSSCLYVYGKKDNKLLCYKLQIDLDFFHMPMVILDDDLKNNYNVKENSIFLLIEGDKRLIHKILKFQCPIWMLTSKDKDYLDGVNIIQYKHKDSFFDYMLLNIIENILIHMISEILK